MDFRDTHSDPGAPRIHPIGKQRLPQFRHKSHRIEKDIVDFNGSTRWNDSNISNSYQGRISLHHKEMKNVGVSAGIETRSVGVNAPSVVLLEKPKRKRRCCLMRFLMAPCDFLEWLIKKWWHPNEDCLRCVNVTYWVVVIVGGIISAVISIAPIL